MGLGPQGYLDGTLGALSAAECSASLWAALGGTPAHKEPDAQHGLAHWPEASGLLRGAVTNQQDRPRQSRMFILMANQPVIPFEMCPHRPVRTAPAWSHAPPCMRACVHPCMHQNGGCQGMPAHHRQRRGERGGTSGLLRGFVNSTRGGSPVRRIDRCSRSHHRPCQDAAQRSAEKPLPTSAQREGHSAEKVDRRTMREGGRG